MSTDAGIAWVYLGNFGLCHSVSFAGSTGMALLGAYECGCLNCFEMRFFNGVSFEDVGYEGCRERVACAYSVGHLHFGCGLERNVAWG